MIKHTVVHVYLYHRNPVDFNWSWMLRLLEHWLSCCWIKLPLTNWSFLFLFRDRSCSLCYSGAPSEAGCRLIRMSVFDGVHGKNGPKFGGLYDIVTQLLWHTLQRLLPDAVCMAGTNTQECWWWSVQSWHCSLSLSEWHVTLLLDEMDLVWRPEACRWARPALC